jgi:hypothetical protein
MPIILVKDRAAPSWTWRQRWQTGADSGFGLLMKFALLNAISGRDIAELFLSRTHKRRAALLRGRRIDMRDTSVFDVGEIAKAFGTPLDALSTAFAPAATGSGFEDIASNLRWCEQCMGWGLHMPEMQSHVAQRCPLHGTALLVRCRCCDQPIPYELSNAVFKRPFQCPTCDVDLAPSIRAKPTRVPYFRDDELSRLSRFRHRLKMQGGTYSPMLRGAGRAQLSTSGPDGSASLSYASFIRNASAFVDDWKDEQMPLSFSTVMAHRCARRTPTEHIDEDQMQYTPASFDSDLEVVVSCYRFLRRAVFARSFSKHRVCFHEACRHFWWDVRGEETPRVCRAAAAFILWRGMWEGCGTPRYLTHCSKRSYHGVVGWLCARPLEVPKSFDNAQRQWVLAHVFKSACLASLQSILDELRVPGRVRWETRNSAVTSSGHWAIPLDSAKRGEHPLLILPCVALPELPEPTVGHLRWHRKQLAAIQH